MRFRIPPSCETDVPQNRFAVNDTKEPAYDVARAKIAHSGTSRGKLLTNIPRKKLPQSHKLEGNSRGICLPHNLWHFGPTP